MRRSLIYLGPFAAVDCRGQHARVHQLWLWQEETRLYAVGVFATLPSGRRAGFVSPVLLGDGVVDGERWSFAWSRDGRSGTASIALTGTDARLALTLDGRTEERAVLTRKAVFLDEAMELAPLTSKADWDHWFDIMLVGHFSSGDVPAC